MNFTRQKIALIALFMATVILPEESKQKVNRSKKLQLEEAFQNYKSSLINYVELLGGGYYPKYNFSNEFAFVSYDTRFKDRLNKCADGNDEDCRKLVDTIVSLDKKIKEETKQRRRECSKYLDRWSWDRPFPCQDFIKEEGSGMYRSSYGKSFAEFKKVLEGGSTSL